MGHQWACQRHPSDSLDSMLGPSVVARVKVGAGSGKVMGKIRVILLSTLLYFATERKSPI